MSAPAPTSVQTLQVAADEADLRLDRWFKRHFPVLGHGRLEKLLRTGQIALHWGADDFGGTLFEESVHAEAEYVNTSSVAEIRELIREAGFAPYEPNGYGPNRSVNTRIIFG